jgi:hypothetical protein
MSKFRDPAEAYGHKLRKMCLARDLPEVLSEPIFGASWLVDAFCHQRFDPLLDQQFVPESQQRAVEGLSRLVN